MLPKLLEGAHPDVLDDVGEDLSPFDHTLIEDEQRFFEKDHVGRFLRDVDRGVHGDSDVGRVNRGRVVDPVTHETHRVAARLQRTHDPLFVSGRYAREQRRFFGRDRKVRVAHRFDCVAQERNRVREADLIADFARDELIVARDDFHRHAMSRERFDRRSGGLFRRIEEGDISD